MLIPVTAYPIRSRGMGATAGQIGLQLGSVGASGASMAALTGASIAASAVTAGIAAVAILVMALLSRKGPAQKVATTNIVNQVEPLMRQNLAAWNASAKTCADQAAALANFDALWGEVVANCAQSSLGDPGHSCLDDRLPAGVKFAYNTFNINGNGMYDWFSYYRAPIENDPAAQGCCPVPACYFPGCVPASTGCVPQSASSGANAVAGVTLPGGMSLSALAIPAALLALLWAVS